MTVLGEDVVVKDELYINGGYMFMTMASFISLSEIIQIYLFCFGLRIFYLLSELLSYSY